MWSIWYTLSSAFGLYHNYCRYLCIWIHSMGCSYFARPLLMDNNDGSNFSLLQRMLQWASEFIPLCGYELIWGGGGWVNTERELLTHRVWKWKVLICIDKLLSVSDYPNLFSQIRNKHKHTLKCIASRTMQSWQRWSIC